MNTLQLMDIAFSALERRKESPTSTDTAHKSYVIPQGQEDATNAGLGSVEAGTLTGDKLVIAQQRQSIYGYERLIEQLYDLLPERVDDAYDLVRAKYLAIHGPRD